MSERAATGRRMLALLGACSLLAPAALAQAPSFADVAAIFDGRCVMCHGGEGAPLALHLDSYEGVMAGSARGPVVLPGEAEESELVKRIEGRSLPRMPLTGPPFLDDAQIALIRDWIAAGAPGPDAPVGAAGTEEGGAAGTEAAADAEGTEPQGEASDTGFTFASVEPIFMGRCVGCHTDGGAMGAPPEGLRLDSYERVIAGGERVVVVPGQPLASELYRRVVGHSLPRMPLDGPPFLSGEEIDAIARWIEEGAQDGEGRAAQIPAGGEVRLGGRLSALWELDGLLLEVTDATRRDDEPGVGDFVEVRGVVTPEGGVRVERIRVR